MAREVGPQSVARKHRQCGRAPDGRRRHRRLLRRPSARRRARSARPTPGKCRPTTRSMPRSRSIASLFQRDHTVQLRELRELALEVMRELAAFNPYLTGSVLRGSAGKYADIQIQLFCDNAKSVEHYLLGQRHSVQERAVPALRRRHGGACAGIDFQPRGIWHTPRAVLAARSAAPVENDARRENARAREGRRRRRTAARRMKVSCALSATSRRRPQSKSGWRRHPRA